MGPTTYRYRQWKQEEYSMLRQSLIAASVAVATITAAASIGLAQTQTGAHQRAIVHHAYTYEPAPNPYYYPYYTTYYGPYYYGPSPVAPVANAAGAAVCAAFSLIGAC
jgi:hypothetical protein